METRETLICHKCGGTGKPSKGIMNFHNIQTSDRIKEFETKLLDCIKCESCGHSWIPETSTREQALTWWNTLPVFGNPSKEYYIGLYYSDDSVTPERIEEIYDKEHKSICNYCNSTINSCSDIEAETCENLQYAILEKPHIDKYGDLKMKNFYKPNQKKIKIAHIGHGKPNAKEFKQFDESLFRAYIDKLPESESLNMIKIIYENKLPDCKFKAHLDKWFKL